MKHVKSILFIGWLLILVGAGALVIDRIPFKQEEKVVDLGPIEASVVREKRFEHLPIIFGVIVIASGITLLFLARRKKK